MRVIGVDAGGTNLRLAAFEGSLTPSDLIEIPTPSTAEELVGTIAAHASELGPADAVGVAVAGLVDHAAGMLVWSPHLDHGVALGTELSGRLGASVAVDNDANAAALAEGVTGAGRGHRMVLMVTVGTGIGGGLVIDGRLERGRAHLGEIGHMPLDPDGTPCACGLLGCWEAVASGTALDRAARSVVAEDATGVDLMAAADAGDQAASDAVDEVAGRLLHGLAVLVSVLDPDVIVVGGGAGPGLIAGRITAVTDGVTGAVARAPTPVLPAQLGPDAGLVGAALLAGAEPTGS